MRLRSQPAGVAAVLLGVDLRSVPARPGCYRFYDHTGRVLYVGKAKSLRDRLRYYEAGSRGRATHGLVAAMLGCAARFDFVLLDSEAAACAAEAQLIRSLAPPFNLRVEPGRTFRLGLSAHAVPRLFPLRSQVTRRARVFGPFASAADRDRLADVCQLVWGLRTCDDRKFALHQRRGQACLLASLGRCSAPCVARDGYGDAVSSASALLSGDVSASLQRLDVMIDAQSSRRAFESAGRLHALSLSLTQACEDARVSDRAGRVDVLALAADKLGFAAALLCVSDGMVFAADHCVLDLPAADVAVARADVAVAAMRQLSVSREPAGRLLVCERELVGPLAADGWKAALCSARDAALAALAGDNASAALGRHRAVSVTAADAVSSAVAELTRLLDTPAPVRVLDAVDVSHFHGSGTVASFVRFVDGGPQRRSYRRVALGDVNDDVAAVRAAVSRRFAHVPVAAAGGRVDGTMAQPPDLLLVDGGPAQLRAARDALDDLGLPLPVLSLAKRVDEVFAVPDGPGVLLPLSSPALRLLQFARDEAHRDAKRFQVSRRRLSDPLDGIAGLGPSRRARLLEAAGDVGELALWPRERFDLLTWLPRPVADAVFGRLSAT